MPRQKMPSWREVTCGNLKVRISKITCLPFRERIGRRGGTSLPFRERGKGFFFNREIENIQ